MSDQTPSAAPGWYQAPGDPDGTQRYWDGTNWVGGPEPISQQAPPTAGSYDSAGASPGMTPSGRTLATAGQRIGARLIDTVIVVAIGVFMIAAIVGTDVGDVSAGFLLGGIAFGFLYEAVTVSLLGGSPGKLILGLAVVTADTDETPPGWTAGILRWIPGLVSNIPVIGPIIGLVIFIVSLVWLFNDEQRRTVYDRIAKTMVIQTN
jgi:uncharacterized RDD family membrane protein YckC